MEAIRADLRLRLQVVAAGMHLDRRFGRSVREVQRHFRIDARVPMLPPSADGAGMALALGRGIEGMTRAFRKLRPDAVLVLGDRAEAFAAAVAAAHMGIVVGHLHGGDISEAGVDDPTRDAITRFTHLHFPATRRSAERIRKMGEESWRVHLAGAPGMDVLRRMRFPPQEEVRRRFGLPARPSAYFLVVFHPVSSRPEAAGKEVRALFSALNAVKVPSVMIYPNSDAGGGAIIREIRNLRDPGIRVFRTLTHQDYLALMRYASALVGNSSSGIIEAPALGTPSVQVGRRQWGREHGKGVSWCAVERKEIEKALRRVLSAGPTAQAGLRNQGPSTARPPLRNHPYGDGRAADRIVRVLKQTRKSVRLLQKRVRG
jgi:UDP-N-acetylglucosamine 2-epimerase (non-hydrolysing)/GDP/UDP-N,N'-diacetylbacillosamine 2-epimerase (hydrolysing)